MNTKRAPARRANETVVNEGVVPRDDRFPQDEQVAIANQGNKALVVPLDMTNEEVRGVVLTLARAMTPQANKDIGPRVNAVEDFMRMNPSTFLSSMVVMDP